MTFISDISPFHLIYVGFLNVMVGSKQSISHIVLGCKNFVVYTSLNVLGLKQHISSLICLGCKNFVVFFYVMTCTSHCQ